MTLWAPSAPQTPPSGTTPATADFLKWWRMSTTRKSLLAKIVEGGNTPIAPGLSWVLNEVRPEALAGEGPKKTLYLADDLVWTRYLDNQTQVWQPALEDGDDITAPGELLGGGPDLCSAAIKISRVRLHYQTSGDVADSFQDFRWEGARVTLYLWVLGRDGSINTLQVFDGTTNRPVLGLNDLTLNLIQDRTWTRALPASRITKKDHPNAPDGNWGRVLPVVIGDWRGPPMRRPWADAYTYKTYQEQLGGGCLMIPGICVDQGTGPDTMKVAFAGHKLMDSFCTAAFGETVFIAGGDYPSPIWDQVPGGLHIHPVITYDLSYFTVDDELVLALAPIMPVDVRVVGDEVNTAINPRFAMDPRDEVNFAKIGPVSGTNQLQLIVPSVAKLGESSFVGWIICYRTSGPSDGLEIYQRSPASSGGESSHQIVAASAAPAAGTYLGDLAWVDEAGWNFGLSDAGQPADLRVVPYPSADGARWGKVFMCGVVVVYKPQPKIVVPRVYGYGFDLAGRPVSNDKRVVGNPYITRQKDIPEIKELASTFQANVRGYPDEDGTYTGEAGLLVELVPDVMRLILNIWGGVRLADMESSTNFGSFELARGQMTTKENRGIRVSMHLANSDDTTATVLQRLASETTAMIFMDRFDSIWRLCPWVIRPPADYPYTIRRDDILGDDGLEVEPGSDTEVVNAVEVQYGLEPYKGTRLWNALVNPRQSGQDFEVIGDSDQYLHVLEGENDTIRFSLASTSPGLTAVLGAGYYSGGELAVEAQAQMRAADSDSTDWFVGWGTAISTGHNDKIRLTVGGTSYTLGLEADPDHTPESLASYLETLLNSAIPGLGASLTYSRFYSLFTLTTDLTATLDLTTAERSMWPTLGFLMGTDVTDTTFVANYEIRQEHFWVAYAGTDGHLLVDEDAFTAGNLLGFYIGTDQGVDDVLHLGSALANVRRGHRQMLAEISAGSDRYGEKKPVKLASEFIRQTVVATHVRDTILDFRCFQPIFITIRTASCPDLQRGRVIRLSADVDSILPFPGYESNGSWANRCFRVLSVNQATRAPYEQQIRAVEVKLGASPSLEDVTGLAWVDRVVIEEGLNDKVEWQCNSGDYAAMLTPGNYTLGGICQHVAARMYAQHANVYLGCGYSFKITTSHNDVIRWTSRDSGGAWHVYAATIPAGTYTAQGLADAVVAAMVAAEGAGANDYALTYNAGTSKFTMEASRQYQDSGTDDKGWMNLGWGLSLGTPSLVGSLYTTTGGYVRNLDRVYVEDAVLQKVYASRARSAWPTLGFGAADITGLALNCEAANAVTLTEVPV